MSDKNISKLGGSTKQGAVSPSGEVIGPRPTDESSSYAVPEERASIKGKTEDKNAAGVYGFSKGGCGVFGRSENWVGVYGEHGSLAGQFKGGVEVTGDVRLTGGLEVSGKSGGLAGRIEGDLEVTGDIRLINADCAENFDIGDADFIEPGTVIVVGEKGALHQSNQANDKRVAGVVSGAGDYKPGIVLDEQPSESSRQPIALLGKVYCKVDARYGSIEVGDLLTTSPAPGHAMRVDDPLKALGAMIGKALRPLKEGQGLIPILIALQ
ncbi:MAG: hypothetical protein PHY16_15655 [Methylobacter sp.]|nr:hypothetical protein [Methylobacter sp.]